MYKIIKRYGCIILLFLIIFVLYVPCASSLGQIYECESIIEIDYDKDMLNKPLLPVNMTITVPVQVKYFVEGFLAKYVSQVYTDMGIYAFVYPEIAKTPEWCEASVSPSFLLLPATTDGVISEINLTIKINRNAHAFDKGDISIKFFVERMGAVLNATYIKNVSFTTGYLSLLKVNTLGSSISSIDPDSTANFDIEIENIGNAKTYLTTRIVDMPEGWTVNLPSELILGAGTIGEETKKTIRLSVKPPYSFGYHNEAETVTVALKPSYFNDKSISGEEYYIKFLIKNKGFSTPGFELIYLLILIAGISLITSKKLNQFKKGGKK